MKYIFKILTLFIILNSCQQSTENAITSPFMAEVLSLNPMLPFQTQGESATYTFETKTFKYLTDFNKLSGKYFKLYRGGSISEDQNSLKFTAGADPHLHYKLIDHVAVPQDYPTMAMLSAYYQFDFIADSIENMTGISMDSLFKAYGQIEIFFEPKFSGESGGFITDSFPKANASYMPNTHKFILYSKSNIEHVPLTMNLQVIAHEFGHGIWEFAFDNQGNIPTCNRLGAEYSIAGLNEGFADFLSYTLTGSTNILASSLDFADVSSMRNFSRIKFNYDMIEGLGQRNEFCNQQYYCTGSLFANALFKTQKKLGYNQTILTGVKSRGKFLTDLVRALQGVRNNMPPLPKTPKGFKFCAMTNDTDTFYNGIILGAFFNSLLNEFSDTAMRRTLCQSLIENFGQIGFPYEFRHGACR